jgi:hypothetical protein
MHKKIAVLQSNYIPWKGYFDLIASVDEFILYDDVQFTKNDWRNRNKIKTKNGLQWLTVPVGQDINRQIKDVEINDCFWQLKHWNSIYHSYHQSPHFNYIGDELKYLLTNEKFTNLSLLNRTLIEFICKKLSINTKISYSYEYNAVGDKNSRLINLCRLSNASEYISGPSARNYLIEDDFNQSNIKVTWFNYDNYPEYPQLWGSFEHSVSIIDLLFNTGPNASAFIKKTV